MCTRLPQHEQHPSQLISWRIQHARLRLIYFITHRSAETPSAVSHRSLSFGSPLLVRAGGLRDLRLGGVELRLRRRAAGGEGDRRLFTGEGDRFLTGEGDLTALLLGGDAEALAGDMETLRRGGGDPDLCLTGELDLPWRRGGDKDLRVSSSYLGAESIMTESPE